MKIALLKSIGSYGVILQPDNFISGAHLKVESEHDGVLTIGDTSHRIKAGTTYIRECEISQGISSVVFVDQDGARYDLGHITRSGRSLDVANRVDELTVALARAYDDQAKKLREIKNELKSFKDNFGISII